MPDDAANSILLRIAERAADVRERQKLCDFAARMPVVETKTAAGLVANLRESESILDDLLKEWRADV